MSNLGMKGIVLGVYLAILLSPVLTFSQKDVEYTIPLIGDDAPSFKAQSTKGEIRLPEDYWNKWVVFFSHPADFTPICTSELMSFAKHRKEFKELNCELLGLSTDGINSHVSWIKDIKEIKFDGMENITIDYPIISDFGMEISKKYGMMRRKSKGSKTVRAVFIVDPNHNIRSIVYYPETTDRNIPEKFSGW